MAKFNSATTKLAKTPLTRDEAVDRARLLRDKVRFYDQNPTIDDDKYEQMADLFQALVKHHGITPEELSGRSTAVVQAKNSLKRLDNEESPISIFNRQPLAVEDMQLTRANKMDRDHDKALGFKIGYNPTTNEWDTEGFGKAVESRRAQFSPEDHPEIHPDDMDKLREAHAMGMDPEDYKKATRMGVPHDYLTQVFMGSARPHNIQDEYATELGGIGNISFDETEAGSTVRGIKEDLARQEELPQSDSQELESGSGFMPIRVSVMKPTHIAEGFKRGISPEEMLDAWHNNGFHPLRNFNTRYTYPISRYITTRDAGANHEEARALLSSLTYIPNEEIRRSINNGVKPMELLSRANRYQDVSLEGPQTSQIEPQQPKGLIQ